MEWRLRTRSLSTVDHTLIMGIVNTTPDSFSDGGAFHRGGTLDASAAVAHGLQLLDDGADILDVGGESTRPGADPVDAAEELARVIPVVSELSARGAVVSIDTSKPAVAAAAIDAGAEIVNDVTGLSDPAMFAICAGSNVGVVIMHMLGSPRTMQDDPSYTDVVAEVGSYLSDRAADAMAAGVARESICIDPGIGFGKTTEHNLVLLHRLGELTSGRFPVLVGTSRKRFLGELLGGVAARERDVATAATVALAVARGASVVRVHNVAVSLQAARIADAIVRATDQDGD